MRKYTLLPLLALLGGLLGAIFRQKQLDTGFEPDTGLAVSGNIYALLLILLTLIMALLFAAFLRRTKLSRYQGGLELGSSAIVYPFITGLGSAALFLAAVFGFLRYYQNLNGDLLNDVILPAAGVICALSTFIFSVAVYRRRELRKFGLAAIIPIFFTCFWLIVCYRAEAANPVTQAYVYEILALSCGALGFYYAAGFVFNRYSPAKAVFFQLMCVYFLIINFSETVNISDILMYMFLGVYMIVYSFSILRNADSR